MTSDTTIQLVICIATILGCFGGLIAFVFHFGAKVSKMETHNDAKIAELTLKTNVMWDFQMRRAMSEATSKGLATMNSPLTLTADGRKAKENMEPIAKDLQSWWDVNYFKDDMEASLDLERNFGDKLLAMVCIPCGLSHGACLFLALMVAKDVDTIDFGFHK